MEMPDNLTEAEKYLIAQVAKGEFVNYSSGDTIRDKPTDGSNWGLERTIRAGVIRALCMGDRERYPMPPRGLVITGARIEGDLDLGWLTIPVPLGFIACYINRTMILYQTNTLALNLSGSHLANGLRADGATIKSYVLLGAGFSALGEVCLMDSNIGGHLSCEAGHFENPMGCALNACRLSIKGNVFLRDGFIARGRVDLTHAYIGGSLSCKRGRFENPEQFALIADCLTVEGDIFLTEGFVATGEVRVSGTDIGGQLNCSGGCFENPESVALTCDDVSVRGSVLLSDGFAAKGTVQLINTDIGGALNCSNGNFDNQEEKALVASRVNVTNSVSLGNGFVARGEVAFIGCAIGGQLNCIGGTFENGKKDALTLQNTTVNDVAFLSEITIRGGLNLLNSNFALLADDLRSWPEEGVLILDGFQYGSINGEPPIVDAKSRLKWLALQPTQNKLHGFRPQPYEQLAKVLRAMGHERDARIIAIAKQKEMRKTLGPLARAWSWILRISTGYGYETWRAFIGMALMVAIGTAVFSFANGNGDMVATSDGAYVPIFNAFIYSLDAFLPIVDLHQETYWLPLSEPFKWYLWFHISAGWILSTISVAAFTGLFKDE